MFTNPANCAGTDTEDWFSDKTNYENKDILDRICKACEAKAECLDYALNHSVLGYWAGTSEIQRRRIRKTLNIIPQSILTNEWEWKERYA